MSEQSSAVDGRRYLVSQIPDLGFWPDDIGVPGDPRFASCCCVAMRFSKISTWNRSRRAPCAKACSI
jgi:hypothetical protein